MGDRYRHKKRGTEYVIVSEGEIQAEEPLTDFEVVVIYRGTDGRHWVRRKSEFHDGRFEPLAPAVPAELEGLIDRLEAAADFLDAEHVVSPSGTKGLYREAATALRALAEDRDCFREHSIELTADCYVATERADALAADNERLKGERDEARDERDRAEAAVAKSEAALTNIATRVNVSMHIENIAAKVNILRAGQDWSWNLSYGPSSDGEWLFNFRISQWADDPGEQPVVWWGTARTVEAAVDGALDSYASSRKAMG